MKKYISIIVAILLTGCKGNLPYDLGNNYFIDFDSNGYYTVYLKNQQIVGSDIIEMNCDSTFIIAEVKPISLIFKSFEGKKDLTYDKENEIIRRSRLREYWIINKKKRNEYAGYIGIGNSVRANYSNVYGPFNEKEFNEKRKELAVSNDLKLLRLSEFLNKEYNEKK